MTRTILLQSLKLIIGLLPLSTAALLITAGIASAQQLSTDYYAATCPRALPTIQGAVFRQVYREHRMGASLLRLHFHDCFVNGCDASVLLNDTSTFTGEQTAGANAGSLRGFDVVDEIKAEVENVCPGVVSCADILAVAARDSVVALGGPSWDVELGRRDSTDASLSAANADIPSPIMNLSALISAFQKKGLTADEMVALSGAHTTGKARCRVFRNRIYNESNIAANFVTSLKDNCPSIGSDDNLAPLDATTPVTFDNAYFTNLQDSRGLIHSDQQLFSGGSTDSLVNSYSSNTGLFFQDFGSAMVKMGRISPLTGNSGQIRTQCWKIN